MAHKEKFRWGKWASILVVMGAAVGGGAWYLKNNHEAPTEYQTTPVTRGDLTQAVTATGQLAPVQNVQVGSQISGIVIKLYADFNSVVKSNQVVAEIDPSPFQISVLKAEADLANAKANMVLAKVQASRADSLFNDRLISASDHDTAKAQMQQAEAQVQSAEATLKNAQVQLSYCKIYAPVDGVVISRSVDVGQTVAASFNTPTLFAIANDLTKMQIDALVSEADIGGVAVGQDANFTVDAYPYRTFHGKVSQIRYGAVTNQNVVNYDCVVQVENHDLKLLPSMTANVSIIVAQRQNALKIPNAALRFRPPDATNLLARATGPGTEPNTQASPRAGGGGPGGGRSGGFGSGGERRSDAGAGGAGRRPRPDRTMTRTVYVLPDKAEVKDPDELKPKAVQIKVGISDGISTEVVEGLQEGMQVVIGIITTDTLAGRPASNPFGGGFRRF